MRATMLLCTVLFFYCAQAQTNSGIYINPSVGFFRFTTDNATMNNSPLMIDGKIGLLINKNEGIGIEITRAMQHAAVSGISSLQPGGGGTPWTRYGTRRQNATSFGLFYEKFLPLGKHLYFFPAAYLHYLHYTDKEEGHIVAGTDSSMTYAREALHNYIGRTGINLNLQYVLNGYVSITAKFAQVDCRIWNRYEQHIFFELPVLIGVKYLFKK